MLCLILGAPLSALAGGPISFSRDIQPILSDNCFECHGPDEAAREADLRLDRKDDLLAAMGGEHDDIDASLQPENNELLRRLLSDDPDEVMPPPETKRSLSTAQKQLIQQWIAEGAKWEGHWAFESPQRPQLPAIPTPSLASWPANGIDYFVLARINERGLKHQQPASRAKLLRRVTLDLTGVPPTIEELDQFLQDLSPNAYEHAVEQLLASPKFGETMAMDWLDAARYADTNGYQGDRERTMWPWRDWVIQTLNQDMPFDQFTRWQLAGDLLPNATEEQRRATGFCRNHMINGEGGRIAEENRVEYVFDQIETVGTVWMGLTVQCCRCHDHKFDPMAQSEYYKFFAFFNQTPISGGGGDPQMAPNLPVPSFLQSMEIAKLEAKLATATDGLRSTEERLTACELPKDVADLLAKKSSDRNSDQWKQLEQHFANDTDFAQTAKQFRAANEELRRTRGRVPKVMVMQDMPAERARKTYILDKGLYNQRGDTVPADTPSFLPPLDSTDVPNRLDLANWLTSPKHPLTARVTVNRVWQKFFGSGLVKTVDDFGVQGEKPTHPQLLDWLAIEFIDSGWNLKQLVRLIVNSSTYQQSATISAESLEADPENRWLARGPRHRMPAWMIRDHALATSGLLVETLGGESVKTYQPAGVWADASFGKKKYQQDHGAALYRRSLYIYWRRIVGPTVFFDMSKRQTCSVKAAQTNTPLHALVTLNDVTYVEAARTLATRLLSLESTDEDRLRHGFRLLTSRAARASEVDLLQARLESLRVHYGQDMEAANQLIGVGDTHSIDLPPADLAAYTTVCLLMMNLDEALNK